MKTIQELIYTNGTIEDEVQTTTEAEFWNLVTDWGLNWRDRQELKSVSVSLLEEFPAEEKGFETKPIYSFLLSRED